MLMYVDTKFTVILSENRSSHPRVSL